MPETNSKRDASKCPQANQKKRLGLTRSCITAVIHHPNAIDIPTLSELCTKAKLTLISSTSTAQDPLISELTPLLMEDYFLKSQCIHNPASKFLEKARSSVASINQCAMNYQCKKMFQGHRVETWNDKLSQLSVKKKVSQSH